VVFRWRRPAVDERHDDDRFTAIDPFTGRSTWTSNMARDVVDPYRSNWEVHRGVRGWSEPIVCPVGADSSSDARTLGRSDARR
jgi:hypothetical protein